MESLLNKVSSNFLPGILLIALLMPFWYIAIYLFHREFYKSSSQVLCWCFCFYLATCWVILCGVFVFALIDFSVAKDIKPGEPNPILPIFHSSIDVFYFFVGLLAILFSILFNALNYIVTRKKPKDFYKMLINFYVGTSTGMGVIFCLRLFLG
jgi:hypothetical protein